MSLKCFFIYFLSLCTFALSEELVIKELKDVGLKNYDERSFRYVVDVTGYKPPLMEFYKTKDLSGSPAFSIRKNGLFVKNKISCSFNTLSTNERTEEILDETCTESPFVIDDSDGPYSSTLFIFNSFDPKNNIGMLKKNEKKYYFNGDDLKNYKIHPPTIKKLEKFLNKKDIAEIKQLLVGLRKVIVNKNIFALENHIVKLYGGGKNVEFDMRHRFKKVFDGKKMKDYQYQNLLSATFLELYSYNKYNDFVTLKNNTVEFCLNYNEKIYSCFYKKNDKWSISTFNISKINE